MGSGDSIKITGIHVRAAHGVLADEKVEPQDFYVDVEFNTDTTLAAATDDVAHAVNYAEVTERVVDAMTREHADLIETLAQRVADAVLEDFRIERARITIHKPNAPIPHEFNDVSVTIRRDGLLRVPGSYRYVVAIGSNLEDPESHVRAAIKEISQLFSDATASSLYRSAPILAHGQDAQPAYINAVVIGVAPKAPLDLWEDLENIEGKHGRVRTERWGARTLDLDVIAVEDIESTHPHLLLPHPRAHERRFVLEPWHEIEPDAELGGTPISELLEQVQDQDIHRIGVGE